MRNLRWVLNTLAKFRPYMITLTVSKDSIYVYLIKKEETISSLLKLLPNNRVAKIFIVCLHYEIFFFGIFHCFTNTIATKNLSSLLKIEDGVFCRGRHDTKGSGLSTASFAQEISIKIYNVWVLYD